MGLTPDQHTEAEAVASLAIASATPHQLEHGEVYLHTGPGGKAEMIRLDSNKDLFRGGLNPIRKSGRAEVHDTDSLIAYVGIHNTETTRIYASLPSRQIVAVLDDQPGWTAHRVALNLRFSDEWQAWKKIDGVLMGQQEFAEFLEDHISEIREPAAAIALEIAQSIQGSVGAQVRSANRLDNGEIQFSYVEAIDATAGKEGKMAIPRRLLLGMTVHENGKLYAIGANFRYRIGQGGVKLGIRLDTPLLYERSAFHDTVAKVKADLGTLAGSPPIPLLLGSPIDLLSDY